MFSDPVAILSTGGECLLCQATIDQQTKKQDVQNLTNAGWPKVREYAEKWAKVRISRRDKPWSEYMKVWDRIRDMQTSCGKVHSQCRRDFTNASKLSYRKELYSSHNEVGEVSAADEPDDINAGPAESATYTAKRSRCLFFSDFNKKAKLCDDKPCFVCLNKRTRRNVKGEWSDVLPFRIELESACHNLLLFMNVRAHDNEDPLQEAAQRLRWIECN
jgi:hypothetical protein